MRSKSGPCKVVARLQPQPLTLVQEINRQSRRVVYYTNALDNLSSYGASLPQIPDSHHTRRKRLEAHLALATSHLATLRGRAKEAISRGQADERP